ncbi:MAG: type II toxin-antitoxin system HipA family toxin [Desulfococcaceae bacterium]
MAERQATVFIYLPGETAGVPAGRFYHDPDAGVGRFAYGRRYVERPNALPVDPVALPLGPPPRETTANGGVYGAFRDSAPDYWGRLVIAMEMGAPPEAVSEMDYLLAAGVARTGNLDFRVNPEDPEPGLHPPQFNDLVDVMEAARRIESDEAVEPRLLRLLRQGSSMGGARPKCTVEWGDGLWIAKFPAKGDRLNIPRIEYAAMTLAGRCGIRTPEVRLISMNETDIFLVRRFDREKRGDGWLRRGFVSALSLMQWDEQDRPRWDYPSLADVMRRHVRVDDIRELFRRMVFNILVRNTDDHPRNHGFLMDERGLSLSPAYDIVPTPARAGVGTDFHLAMSVGEAGRTATLKNALSRSARFGLPHEAAFREVESIKDIAARWREHFGSCSVSSRELELLAPSFQRCDERL